MLNCDLGESFGAWNMGMDEEVMPYIHQANVACGFHAGDPVVMKKTLLLARRHNVMVGAHPSYPDIEGFGRRSMRCQPAEIVAMIQYQVGALQGIADSLGMKVAYIKPHGALYNDMMADVTVRAAVMEAVAEYRGSLPLMLLYTSDAERHADEAAGFKISLIYEAFADRCYRDDGNLLPRSDTGAVHDRKATLKQVRQLKSEGTVSSVNGKPIRIRADSLCVHGDNPHAVSVVAAIREIIDA